MRSSGAILETERLRLRPLAAEDLPYHLEMMGDPEMMGLSAQPPRDEARIREWLALQLERHRRDGHGFMACLLKESGEYAGHAGVLMQEVEGETLAEVGYWIRKTFWGRGLATEAATAARDDGFRRLGKERLVSLIHPENLPSRRVAEKMGMRRIREASWRGMKVHVHGIQREEWERILSGRR